jgi:KUP system potassium uptake protein
VEVLEQLSHDDSVPKFATHLVYLTASSNPGEVEQVAIDSIIRRSPKRADIYWFVNVTTTDQPYGASYSRQILDVDQESATRVDVIFVRFNLGFRVEPRLNIMFRAVVQDMVKRKEIDIVSRYKSLQRVNAMGDFRFVIFRRYLSNDNDLRPSEKLILDAYFLVNRLAVSNQEYFGLDTSNVSIENVPLMIAPPQTYSLERDDTPFERISSSR